MRAFRTLEFIAQRMGFMFDNGGTVRALPYAEGQSLVTVADDYRRARVEPQVLTYASRILSPLVAGQYQTMALIANNLPLRVKYIDVQGSTGNGANIENRPQTALAALGVGVNGPIAPLEQPRITTPAAVFQSFPSRVAPFLTNAGFSRSGFGSYEGTFLPRLLLPGEALVFQSDLAQALQIQIVWEQLDARDVLTSRAPTEALGL